VKKLESCSKTAFCQWLRHFALVKKLVAAEAIHPFTVVEVVNLIPAFRSFTGQNLTFWYLEAIILRK
jgi:hypothetical protein